MKISTALPYGLEGLSTEGEPGTLKFINYINTTPHFMYCSVADKALALKININNPFSCGTRRASKAVKQQTVIKINKKVLIDQIY